MASTRRKTARVGAPSTLADAIARTIRYVELDTGVERSTLDLREAIARMKATHDETVRPLQIEARALLGQLGAWWDVAGEEVCEPGRRSAELAGVEMGLRLDPPSLKVPGGEEAAVELLQRRAEGQPALKLDRFLRVEVSLDKPAILAALKGSDDDEASAVRVLRLMGFASRQADKFYIKRPDATPPVETVESLQEAA